MLSTSRVHPFKRTSTLQLAIDHTEYAFHICFVAFSLCRVLATAAARLHLVPESNHLTRVKQEELGLAVQQLSTL